MLRKGEALEKERLDHSVISKHLFQSFVTSPQPKNGEITKGLLDHPASRPSDFDYWPDPHSQPNALVYRRDLQNESSPSAFVCAHAAS